MPTHFPINCVPEFVEAKPNGRIRWQCSRCGFSDEAIPEHFPLSIYCVCQNQDGSGLPACGIGCKLTELIDYIGQEHVPSCPCKHRAYDMDRMGVQWCRETVAETVAIMRTSADERKLFEPRETDSIIIAKARKKAAADFDANAEWLIYLAIKLVEESREPNKYERFKLRLMRYGNRLIK